MMRILGLVKTFFKFWDQFEDSEDLHTRFGKVLGSARTGSSV